MEKVQWNSIDKKQNGLKYSKNDKSSTLPLPMPMIVDTMPNNCWYNIGIYMGRVEAVGKMPITLNHTRAMVFLLKQ